MKVTAYKGHVLIRKPPYYDSEDDYTRQVNVYGETIGEFYDNLLLVSNSVKEEIAESGKERYGADWDGTFPTRSRWYGSFTVPRIISLGDGEESTNTMGRRLDHVNDILFGAFLTLDFAYQEIISVLRSANVEDSRIPQFKYEKKSRGVGYFSPDNSFGKLKNLNFSGDDLDGILNQFIESGEISHILNEAEKNQKQRVLPGEKPTTSPSKRFFSKVLETIAGVSSPLRPSHKP